MIKKLILLSGLIFTSVFSLSSFAASCEEDVNQMLDQIEKNGGFLVEYNLIDSMVQSETKQVDQTHCQALGEVLSRKGVLFQWEMGNWGNTMKVIKVFKI